jgi:serine/threonine protein kinase
VASYARLKEIVAGALAQPADDRAAFLAIECGADAPTHLEAESLLAAAVHAAALYEDPLLLIEGATVSFEALQHVDAAVEEAFTGTDRYLVRRRIGAGGMGIVYEVEDRARQQIVALKTLRRRLGADIYQLKHEFRNLADIAHPNLVSLYDLVIDDSHCFFTMELVEGRTFVEYARQASSGDAIAERVRRALPQLIEGVQELHRRGMQHRDIKPSNVLVSSTDRVVLLDFGLTSDLLRERANGTPQAGTPAYLSPERCLGGNGSNASDWYGVGVTLYHALTGRVPFDGPVRELISRKTMEDPTPVSVLAPETPADLNDVCMGLLHRDPERRLSGRGTLERLSASASGATWSAHTSDTTFVGRDTALAVLNRTWADVTSGRSVAVVVFGPSGIGKSALIQRFINQKVEGAPALLLRSRCHEHESIPYKGLDGVIDSIARWLSTRPSTASSLMPADASALATLFPVLRALGVEPETEDGAADPVLLRRRAFGAFRDLLATLSARQPVVLDIDDLHWADADSARWLTELLRPPALPRVLTLLSFRSEEIEAKPFLRSLVERIDIGERVLLPLTPLSDEEALELADALLPERGTEKARHAGIVKECGGNPFLIEAVAHNVALGAPVTGTSTLTQMLTRRLETLPAESRAFLEALAVCGRPVLPERIYEACGYRGDERPLVAKLRAAHLVRNSRSADRVEMYHDRIRVALATGVAPDVARGIHDVMARVLVAHADDDPEALFEHYRAAGRDSLAAAQAATAAIKASGVLAFDLAATFYRHAITLHPNAAERKTWSAGLARALENAGRPVEAADAYLDAAHRADDVNQVEWQRKAAELFLVGGQIDRGLAVSDAVLRKVGMRLARGPKTAVASLLFRRLQLSWRGLEFTPRDTSSIAPEDLLRIDASWSVSAGLAMVDPVRAAAFNVRQLLRALDVGDPYRIARALALEAGFSVVGAGLKRSVTFSQRADALAEQTGQRHYVTALTSLWAGISAFLTGQWKKASELCGRAITPLRDECTGVVWELNMAHNFFLGGLVSQGELREASRHLPGLLQTARERGNAYLELELNTRMILVWLAGDDPDGADLRANEGTARWSHRGFQRQHYNHLLLRVQTELYRGRASEAWRVMIDIQDRIRRSQLLRVQHTRIEAANYGARCALAMAAAGHDAPRMRAFAHRDVDRLERERRPWASAFAEMIRGTVAHQEGNADEAVERLSAAVNGFDAADMQLYAAGCRRRLGALLGGEKGQALRGDADRWMASQEIRNPDAMTRVIAPGFQD